MSAHIIVIEDDASIRELMYLILSREGGYRVSSFAPRWSGLSDIESLQPDLIIADGQPSRPQSIWILLEYITSSHALQGTPVLLCTGMLDEVGARLNWLEHKGITFLAKPFEIDTLLQIITRRLRERALTRLEQQ